jgi:hypothetical protein
MAQQELRPLLDEIEQLDARLRRAQAEGGGLGQAAKAMLSLVLPHFAREKETVLPLLALLASASQGATGVDPSAIHRMAEAAREELAQLHASRPRLVAAARALADAARENHKPDYESLAEDLLRHIAAEEEVSCPTALRIAQSMSSARRT